MNLSRRSYVNLRERFVTGYDDFLNVLFEIDEGGAIDNVSEYAQSLTKDLKLNFGNPKNSRRYPITPKISKYRRLNLTKNRYQQTPRNMPNFTLIPRCRGKVSSSHCAAAPRFS
uniref:Uncharacterized protein n=1 Tax=Candidatus Methanogaster sp. ANME-2c ERB4 TaxID=2759911 RepID=A0A7G9YJV3_9EURY|nr:hypothetical protein AIPDDCKC_00005 [Methanosarcinales archaeon ANME-2c ERB4]QNO42006.1 hypothetical protein GJLAGEEG_00001 [Methanosarcinales archaeon ANME-2c ERB4]QNO48287.1 hypothetical protein LLAPOPPF_00007 [Methanosarcinales archaeon ANME-2c ERB4]